MVNDSSGDVSSTRALIGSIVRLLVICRLVATVSRTLSTSPWRRQQARFREPVHHVFFGLLIPHALAERGRQLLRLLGVVADRRLVDRDRGEFLCRLGALQVVAPQPHLALDLRAFLGMLFRVDIRRQPEGRLHVGAPAVDVEPELFPRLRDAGKAADDAVEPDDVEVAVFDPEASGKAVGDGAARSDVQHQAADFAEELTPQEREIVALVVQQPPVGHRHGGEAFELERRRKRQAPRALLDA